MAKKKLLDEEIDYSDRIMTQISRGAPVEEVADTLGQRMDKISNNPNLSKYANDRYTQAAMDYIKQGGQNKPFSYEAAPTYTSKYAAQIDSLMNDIFGTTYDGWKQGAEYGALENRYKGLGQNAMQDTLAQVSARTGGMASSYAGGAAQGAYNNYMQSLEEAALALYNNQQAQKQNQFSILQGLENADYNKHRDSVSDAMWQQNFDYNAGRDKVADDRYDAEWQYQLDRDKVADERYDTEWQYQQDRDTISDQRYDAEWQYQLDRDKVADDRYADSLAAGGGVADPGYSISDITKLVENEIIDAETARQMLGLGEAEVEDADGELTGSSLGSFAKGISQRLATDYSLDTPEKKAQLIANAFTAGLITEEEGYYLMSLY